MPIDAIKHRFDAKLFKRTHMRVDLTHLDFDVMHTSIEEIQTEFRLTQTKMQRCKRLLKGRTYP
ncbi:hypothetical protein FLK61_40645 [Paenalkalicoccus suaedae]|uniref:Uncharacterized protein n=1 Tax=Paenalkalicoccus suaedae TaxID=2592382 RepID=A0A859FIF3_9BACI|nr:hypothetical protein [Paenalkalicoccus suaedae]QKS72911.1 hypothetical protein FLK61_40645 [Paenalkalicoccus suaedae]